MLIIHSYPTININVSKKFEKKEKNIISTWTLTYAIQLHSNLMNIDFKTQSVKILSTFLNSSEK